MSITQEQADVLKGIIDQDANLAGANLKLDNLPDYYDWRQEWERENRPPRYSEGQEVLNEWYKARAEAWNETINQALLESDHVGACVIGGLTIAALKAGKPVKLVELANGSGAFDKSLHTITDNAKQVLQEFTGLTFGELLDLQRINDHHAPDLENWYGPMGEGERADNPYYDDPEAATMMRRFALKQKVQSFVQE